MDGLGCSVPYEMVGMSGACGWFTGLPLLLSGWVWNETTPVVGRPVVAAVFHAISLAASAAAIIIQHN